MLSLLDPKDMLEMNVKCSDLIFQFRSVPLSPRLSSELRTRSKGSPVSSHTAFKVQMDSPVWFPVRHHVVQSAFIQKQRNWFWTLFEVLVRVWTIRRYKNPNVWEWKCQIRADVQSETLFLITKLFLVRTEITNLPLPPFTQIQKYNKVSVSSLL